MQKHYLMVGPLSMNRYIMGTVNYDESMKLDAHKN